MNRQADGRTPNPRRPQFSQEGPYFVYVEKWNDFRTITPLFIVTEGKGNAVPELN
jgi:hypothetical protein